MALLGRIFKAALESLRRSLPVYCRHTEIRTIASRSTRACPPRAAPAWWNGCRQDREPRALAADRTGEAGGLVPPGSRRSSADAVTKAKHAQFVGDSLRAPMGKMADIRDHQDGSPGMGEPFPGDPAGAHHGGH